MKLLLFTLPCIALSADLPKWVSEQGGNVEMDAESQITAVKLPFGWVTDADLTPIAAIPTLRSLDLSLSLVSDAGIEKLKDLKNIEDLNLYAVEHLTDVSTTYIRGWRKLEHLNLRGNFLLRLVESHQSVVALIRHDGFAQLAAVDLGDIRLVAGEQLKNHALPAALITNQSDFHVPCLPFEGK